MKKRPKQSLARTIDKTASKELAVIIPGVGVMEKSEFRDYVAYLQGRFPERTDISEESVMIQIEAEARRQEGAENLRGAVSSISIKPWLLKQWRQRGLI
jgi:hypothetical protein